MIFEALQSELGLISLVKNKKPGILPTRKNNDFNTLKKLKNLIFDFPASQKRLFIGLIQKRDSRQTFHPSSPWRTSRFPIIPLAKCTSLLLNAKYKIACGGQCFSKDELEGCTVSQKQT